MKEDRIWRASRTWPRCVSQGSRLASITDTELAKAALCMAAAVRGGNVRGVIFHSGKGGDAPGVVQSTGRVGSTLDNAAAEGFIVTLEWELLSRRHFTTKA